MKPLILTLSLLIGLQTLEAKTDIEAKQLQLRDNLAAAKDNLKQYETNLKTVQANISETNRVLGTLAQQKKLLSLKDSNSQQDQRTVEAATQEVQKYIRNEQALIDQENRQIGDLKELLQRLESNQEKRKANLAIYQERLKKVEGEQAQWSVRKDSLKDLALALEAKETELRDESKKLAAKKAEYETEVQKWQKQVRVSEREYANFSKIKSK